MVLEDDGRITLPCGADHAVPVYYDDQVPSPPSLLKVRHQSVRLSDQPVLFWRGWGKRGFPAFRKEKRVPCER
jgi:hypothetical protein